MVKFTKIYLEGNEEFINSVLKHAKDSLGHGCDIIDLEPELKNG